MKKLFAIALLASFTTLAAPLQWVCDWPEAKSQTFSLYQGETATFEPTFRVNGRTVTNATIEAVWYQTNGMGNAWWKLDGATFAPSNDVGAAAYRFFVEAKTSDDILYRANGALRMLPSPGFTPNEIAAPVQRIDFATVEVSNAPWTEIGERATGNGERIGVLETNVYTKAETESKIVELAPAPGNYAAVSNAAMSAAKAVETGYSEWTLYLRNSAYNGWYQIYFDYNNGYWVVNRGDAEDPIVTELVNATDPYAVELRWATSSGGLVLSYSAKRTQLPRMEDLPTATSELENDGDGDSPFVTTEELEMATNELTTYTDNATNGLLRTETDPTIGLTNGTIYVKGSTITPLTAETADFAPSSLASEVSALRDEIAPAVTAYPRVYAFMTGSTNASFSVTNYQLTAEADAERTHFDPSDPDLDFSTVPSSLRLEDFSTGTNRVVVDTRDWTVWYYAQKIGGAIAGAVSTAVNTCRAWVNFTATGLENPVPDTLIVDVPNIWLMAGKTFEKHVAVSNACWVIRSKDAVMPISDNAQSAGGFLELTDAFGEPYIRFNKTESYFVDPQAEGITNTNGTWYIVYPTQTKPNGGANAAIEGSTTYPGKAVLKAEDDPDCPATITWTGGAGHWVMVAAPKLVGGVYPSKMFFGAVVEVQGQDYIEYLRPMSIPHLIVDGVKIAPQIPASHPAGTTISWKVVE